MKKLIFLLAFLFCYSVFGQEQDEIIGIWWSEEKDGRVEIFKKGDKYYGRIDFIEENRNPDGSQPLRDLNNPNEALRNRVLLGTIILKDLKWTGKRWEGGEIYDSKSGNTYSCFAKMQDDGTLFFKGYIGISLIGRSTTWTRHS